MTQIKTAVLTVLTVVLTLTVWGPVRAQDTPDTTTYGKAPQWIENRGEFEMVLIHGLGASNEIWNDVTPYLKGTFKVWHFELSGHGETSPATDPTIVTEAARLKQFLLDEDIPFPTLVGHGMGGLIALRFSLDHPGDVHRLILLDSAPKQLATPEQKAETARSLVEDYDRFVARQYLQMSLDKDVTETIVDLALRTDSASFISLLMSSFDFDMTSELYTLSVPMLVVGSELLFNDPTATRQILNQIGFESARSLSFKRMGRTGHYMMLERPTMTASVLMAFGVTSDYHFEAEN